MKLAMKSRIISKNITGSQPEKEVLLKQAKRTPEKVMLKKIIRDINPVPKFVSWSGRRSFIPARRSQEYKFPVPNMKRKILHQLKGSLKEKGNDPFIEVGLVNILSSSRDGTK